MRKISEAPFSKRYPAPILIVAGAPQFTEEQTGFSARLLEAVSAVARAAFSRNHPVAVLSDERLLPVLLSISTEYLDPERSAASDAPPQVQLFGHRPEVWQSDFADWETAKLAGQFYEGDERAAVEAVLRSGEIKAVFALGGGGMVDQVMMRLLDEERTSQRRLVVFFIRSVGGKGDLVNDYTRAQPHDVAIFKDLEPILRESGLEADREDSFDELALLYPLIMQVLLDQVDG